LKETNPSILIRLYHPLGSNAKASIQPRVSRKISKDWPQQEYGSTLLYMSFEEALDRHSWKRRL